MKAYAYASPAEQKAALDAAPRVTKCMVSDPDRLSRERNERAAGIAQWQYDSQVFFARRAEFLGELFDALVEAGVDLTDTKYVLPVEWRQSSWWRIEAVVHINLPFKREDGGYSDTQDAMHVVENALKDRIPTTPSLFSASQTRSRWSGSEFAVYFFIEVPKSSD